MSDLQAATATNVSLAGHLLASKAVDAPLLLQEAGVDASRNVSRFATLEKFFCDAFEVDEFIVFLQSDSRLEFLTMWIDPSRCKIHFFASIIGLLNRHGLIDSDFFIALIRVRPHRIDEIRELANIYALAGNIFRNENAMVLSHTLLSAVAEQAPLVIYVKDIDGRFVLSNKLHENLLGRPRGGILGKRESDLLPSEVAKQIETQTQLAISEQRIITSEFTIPLPSGARRFSESLFPLSDIRGNCYGLGGIAVDITRASTTSSL